MMEKTVVEARARKISRSSWLQWVVGQALRVLVAGPGSLTGRYPEGNTGRAAEPATRPMPVPDHLRELLELRRG